MNRNVHFKFITEKQVKQIIKSICNEDYRQIIDMVYYQGLRTIDIPYSQFTVIRAVKRSAANIGMNITPYDLRMSGYLRMKKNGVSIHKIKKLARLKNYTQLAWLIESE